MLDYWKASSCPCLIIFKFIQLPSLLFSSKSAPFGITESMGASWGLWGCFNACCKQLPHQAPSHFPSTHGPDKCSGDFLYTETNKNIGIEAILGSANIYGTKRGALFRFAHRPGLQIASDYGTAISHIYKFACFCFRTSSWQDPGRFSRYYPEPASVSSYADSNAEPTLG